MVRLTLSMLLMLLWAAPARADQCAPREIFELHGPKSGAQVPPNVRFVVWLSTGCSAQPPGRSRFRLVGHDDKEIPLKRVRWRGWTELRPVKLLPPGPHRFQRIPPGGKAWKNVSKVRVGGQKDTAAPRLTCHLKVSVKRGRGLVSLSPCHVKEGAVLAWRARFAPAADDMTPVAQLRHVLLRRRSAKKPWQVAHDLTGPVDKWEEDHGGWGKTWTFRLVARDLAGNTAALTPAARVKAPAR